MRSVYPATPQGKPVANGHTMREIGSFEAKTHLAELPSAVERGQSFTITRRGKPVAVLQPVGPQRADRQAAIDNIRRLRESLQLDWTAEEIRAARDEGRK